MADKGISPRHSRIAWLYDGDPQTPDIAVMLQNTGDQIVLSVPYKRMADTPYGRWFGAGVHFGDDP